ncbi:hypothetical protein ACS0TY_012410 [Phlomoides rotata]
MQISTLVKFSMILLPLFLPPTVAVNSTAIYSNTWLTGAKPGYPSKCGNLTVPYPFGIGPNASSSVNDFFYINCDASFNPPKAFLGSTELQVVSVTEAKIRVKTRLAWNFHDPDITDPNVDFKMNLSGTPFSFSNENKLTVVGCDDVALMANDVDKDWANYISSCVAVCSKPGDLTNGLCSGIGCCQSSIPKGLQSVYTTMVTLNDNPKTNFSPCGYSFLAEQSSYTFDVSDISDTSFVSRVLQNVPLALDWAIGNKTCDQIRESVEKIVCKENSECIDSETNLGGYRCNCSQGYHGNPYLSPGCQDINECELSPCYQNAKCNNLMGSFNCSCPRNHFGDGTKDGTGCILLLPPRRVALYVGLLVGLGSFSLLVISFSSYKILKKRRAKQLKEIFFKRNGGLLLQQQMSAHDSVLEKMRIFTSKELERATDRFSESRVIGRGGQGTVYKGMLSNGRIVAVKKSKQVNQNQHEDFINEVVILSHVNHRNVVKLLGCCMETEVPLLVYEFISNGTLYDLIHDQDTGFLFTWDLRLRIGAEIASALAYLHYATSVPIYHRDMKSTNILLDEKYRAKLSDFGISRLVGIEQSHLTTKVKGTFGYLDPEYFQTGKFTEKSDVYSFGVVLVELLTGEKPIASCTTDDEERSLVTRFLSSMDENHLKSILDSRIIEEGVKEGYIAVSDLAKRCLSLNGKKRPTIREVAMELVSIRSSEDLSFVESYIQDISCNESEESFVLGDDGFSWSHNFGCRVEDRC